MNSEEKRRHSSKLVPFSYYKCKIPEYFNSVPPHWHGEFEINFVNSGCAEFICGDEKFVTHAGDIVLVKPNILHAIYPIGKNSQVYDTIVFSVQMLGGGDSDRSSAECIKPILTDFCKIIPVITPQHVYYGEIKTTVENIFSCAKGNSASLDLLMKSELLRLFWILENGGDIVFQKDAPTGHSEILKPVIDYINRNFSENITISQLCNIAHFSRSYFFSVFKEVTGVGAIEYLCTVRIKNACEMLVATDFSTSQIAFECGFKNLSNFNRHFKKTVGVTPTEYRKIAK